MARARPGGAAVPGAGRTGSRLRVPGDGGRALAGGSAAAATSMFGAALVRQRGGCGTSGGGGGSAGERPRGQLLSRGWAPGPGRGGLRAVPPGLAPGRAAGRTPGAARPGAGGGPCPNGARPCPAPAVPAPGSDRAVPFRARDGGGRVPPAVPGAVVGQRRGRAAGGGGGSCRPHRGGNQNSFDGAWMLGRFLAGSSVSSSGAFIPARVKPVGNSSEKRSSRLR